MLYTQNEDVQLQDRIGEEAYYRNFVGLARTLQPDGERVNMVGFTTVRKGATKQVAMMRAPRETLTFSTHNVIPEQGTKVKADAELVVLRGELLIANATKKSGNQSSEIEIVSSGNVREKVIVPPGMMSDIVKPLWESAVEVTGTRKGKRVHLLQIKAAS